MSRKVKYLGTAHQFSNGIESGFASSEETASAESGRYDVGLTLGVHQRHQTGGVDSTGSRNGYDQSVCLRRKPLIWAYHVSVVETGGNRYRGPIHQIRGTGIEKGFHWNPSYRSIEFKHDLVSARDSLFDRRNQQFVKLKSVSPNCAHIRIRA